MEDVGRLSGGYREPVWRVWEDSIDGVGRLFRGCEESV